MSKNIIVVLIILIATATAWKLLQPKPPESYVQQEISIKQAAPETISTLTYQDDAGFSFAYPSDLTVRPVELDDKSIYSSLELSGKQPGMLTIRISDTSFSSLKDWQVWFEKKNVLSEVRPVRLDDLTGTAFSYGAPKLNRLAAVDSGILYTIESPADNGYWDRLQEQLINSFKFANPPTATDSGITLIEEKYE